MASTSQQLQQLLFGGEQLVSFAEPVYPASRVMLQSGDVGWCSPESILAPAREMGDGVIAFDPMSNSYSLVGAQRALCLQPGPDLPPLPLGMEIGDGLAVPWPLVGLIWINPPFGEALRLVAQKIQHEAQRGAEIISCVPARTGTVWFQDLLRPPTWCAWRGRVKFLEPIVELERRFEERRQRCIAANQKPPERPEYKHVGDYLAESDPAPFDLVLAYHGARRERFARIFGVHGRIYHEGGA